MFKTVWPYLRNYKMHMVLGPALKLAEAIIETLLPYMVALMIDVGIADSDRGYIIKMAVVMLVLVAAGVIMAVSCNYMASVCAQGFGTSLRRELFGRALQFSQEELQELGSTSLLNRATTDVNQMQTAVAMTIRLLPRAPFLCLGSLLMAFYINAELAVLMLIAMPLAALVLFFVLSGAIKVYALVQQRLDKVIMLVHDNLSGARVVRAFAREEHESKFFAGKNREMTQSVVKAGIVSSLMNPVSALIFNAVIILVLWRGGMLADAGSLTRGEMVAFISYLTQLVQTVVILANLLMLYPKSFAAWKRVVEVLQMPMAATARAEAVAQVQETEQAEPESMPGTKTERPFLELQDVTFRYPGSPEPALEHISFTLNKGETIGVIGATGSGKSTLANLLLGFYQPEQGALYMQGRDYKDWDISDLRHHIAYVPQKAVLLSGNLRSNLLLGSAAAAPTETKAEGISDEELWRVLDIAQAEAFVREKENGLDSPVERDGRNFSGGQRQRISMARALLRPGELLILDDATSALDYLTDLKFREALRPQLADRALVFISQRVHVLRNADKILVLDDGCALGLGTHEELMATCELYREIASSQLESEVKDNADSVHGVYTAEQ